MAKVLIVEDDPAIRTGAIRALTAGAAPGRHRGAGRAGHGRRAAPGRRSLDALLGNVFSHTPQGTGYGVTVTGRPGGGARLLVEDGGPGVPPIDAVRRGASGAGSTGLGLDIARRTAVASGGRLTIGTSAGGGARVVVEYGPPTDSLT